MKKIIWLVLLFLVTIPMVALAAPFLVCDSYPSTGEQPDSFEITLVPLAPFIVPAITFSDGSKGLNYDLSLNVGLGQGAHTATAIAIKAGWRSEVSNSVPFVKPNLKSPTNLRIVN